MKTDLKFSLCMFCAVIFTASSCFASAMIPGFGGNSLPLSQISDIMRHVTGKTSGDLTLEKQSMLVVDHTKNDGAKSFTAQSSLFTFDNDGVRSLSGSLNKGTLKNSFDLDLVRGRYPFLLKTDDGSRLTIIDNISSNSVMRTTTQINEDRDAITLTEKSSTSDKIGGNPFERKTGITVKGFDGELFLETSAGETPHSIALSLYYITKDSKGNITTEVVSSPLTEYYLYESDAPKFHDGSYYLPVSFAVGDFDYDGYANEIALVYSDINDIYLKVLSLIHMGEDSSDARFILSEIYSEKLHGYDYYSYWKTSVVLNTLERGRDMDGAVTTYSVQAVAGDFDGDKKQEFVILFRDVRPDAAQQLYIDFKHYTYDSKIDSAPETVPGLAGKFHIVPYKWKGNTFQKAEDKAYDYGKQNFTDDGINGYWTDIDFPLAIKGIAADVNGDGKDELVMMRMMVQCSLYKAKTSHFTNFAFGSYLDVAEFDSGNLKVKETWPNQRTWQSSTWRGLRYGNIDEKWNTLSSGSTRREIFLRVITGNTKPYPVFDREFDIVAGKFTGRMGNIMTCDDVVIKYPSIQDGKTLDSVNGQANYLRSNLVLVSNLSDKSNFKFTNLQSFNDHNHVIGLSASDYAAESVELGDPVKIVTDSRDNNYLAILQAPPYHIDNLTEDGTELQEQPNNFTYKAGSSVSYANSNTVTSKDVVKFTMTNTVETIFAFGIPFMKDVTSAYNTVKIPVSQVLGNELLNMIPGVPKVNEKFSGVTGFIDKFKDSITTTTEKTNQKTATTNINISNAARVKDVVYLSSSERHIWRYPVLTRPVPYWLRGARTDSDDETGEATAKVEDEETYITFSVQDEPHTKTSFGLDDSQYQPFHEPGNLFSYPSALGQVQGYANRTALIKATEWSGPEYKQTISLTKESGAHTVKSSKLKKGLITEAASVIDSIFKTNLAQIPKVPDPKDFTRTTSSTESLTINLPEALSGARYSMLFEGYLDAAGAMTMAFAVKSFNRNEALWGTRSLYSRKPDPSLVLPQKFIYTQKADSSGKTKKEGFYGNNNDPTALEIRGMRISVPDYAMDSNNLLMRGIKYNFEVPVYNASFVKAGNVKLRMSYAEDDDYRGVQDFNIINRTDIMDTTINLPGWGSGNRVMANFTWTPDVPTGTYYVFVEIDPDNEIDEVHENRKDENGNIVDYGGNNLGYFKVHIADSNSPVYDRGNVLKSGDVKKSDVNAADESDEDLIDYVAAHTVLKINGTGEWSEFRKIVSGHENDYMIVDAEVVYDGEYVVPSVNITGRSYKESSVMAFLNGTKPDLTDDDVDVYFLNERISLLPGETQKLHFIVNDKDTLAFSDFDLELPGGTKDILSVEDARTSDNNGIEYNSPGSPNGGCDSGIGSSVAILLAWFAILRGKRKS